MAQYEKPDIIIVSAKGQVVIPQPIRKKLGIGPKTKLLVYSYQDAVVLKKLKIADVAKELEEICKKADINIAKYGELNDEEIDEAIQEHRRKERGS